MAQASDFRESLNNARGFTDRVALGDNFGIAQYVYDFDNLGGAVGDITLTGEPMPDNAVVMNAFVDSVTAVTSGGAATVALKLVSADDLLAATGKASFSAEALIAGVPDFATSGDWVKTTSDTSKVVATVATAALTAGVFYVTLHYVVTG